MDEASGGSDMNHFIVWVYASWTAIIAAGVLALYLPVAMNPVPKPAVVVAEPAPAPLPGQPGFWDTPKRAGDQSQLLDGEDNELVRPFCAEGEVFFFATRLGLPDPAHWLDDATTADHVLTGAGA
ncbi:hypothetical protein ACFU7Z_29195 [Kitasatospora sp. NPDC057518]|uniref:hypothetical protein n=1 Tax=Kitasatospora sp. NPDC057518 TaxID=3346155 RepID=UPI0036D1B9A9